MLVFAPEGRVIPAEGVVGSQAQQSMHDMCSCSPEGQETMEKDPVTKL